MAIPRPDIHVRAAMMSHVGRVRAANEDACVIADLDRRDTVPAGALTRYEVGEHGVLLAVADGMGGARDGAVASAITIETLVHALEDISPAIPATEALEQATRTAHQAVWDESCRAGHSGRTRMGSTLTAALVRGHQAAIAQVGDSRAYLIRGGQILRLTNDQTMLQALIDKGLLREEDAKESPFRNVLVQAMGHQEKLDVTMGELALRDRDCLLLCSDGLTGELLESEIRDVVLMSMRIDVAAKRLVDIANQRGGHDNVTVVMGGIAGALPPASVR